MTALPGVVTVKGGHSRGPMDTRPPLHNILIQKDQNKKTQSYKVESVSGGANMDMHNFSLENKRETEYVSHMCPEAMRFFVLLLKCGRENVDGGGAISCCVQNKWWSAARYVAGGFVKPHPN